VEGHNTTLQTKKVIQWTASPLNGHTRSYSVFENMALRRIFGVKKDDLMNQSHSKSISQYLLFM